ncbi:MAG: serine acetyltransferase [Planctomycetota bacterium]|nr:MAG: serine acetyltransferase [Planctomycetota bacterium]
MREIAFPGFHLMGRTDDVGMDTTGAGRNNSADGEFVEIEAFVAQRVPALRIALAQCIAAARCAVGVTSSDQQDHDGAVDRICSEVLAQIPAIRASLAADVEAAYRGDPAARSVAEVILCYPGITALTAHRFAHELWIREVPILPRMLAEIAHSATGIDIHPGAQIGRGVFIDHGTGVVIGETCTIGEGCRIYQGVTLGAKKFERDADGSLRKGTKRHPTLGARVTVYAGATILGGDTVIGDGSVVAGGVFVMQSVPPGHLVANQKAQVRVLPHGEDPA